MIIPLALLAVHFVADFLLQTDKMALRKSSSLKWLTIHVSTYSLCFLFWGIKFALLTFILHWLTDFLTSRATSKLWFFTPVGVHFNAGGLRHELYAPVGGNRHWFFVMIGLDQLIHFLSLGVAYKLFV